MEKTSDKNIEEIDISYRYQNYTLAGRLWINGESKKFLGYGRILFLQKIKELGSISEAARDLKMSYKHAWDIVDAINKEATTPLVHTIKGGKGGGGAKLTNEGERITALFVALYQNFKDFLKDQEAILRDIDRTIHN